MNPIPDGLTVAIAGNLGLFITIVDPNGQATRRRVSYTPTPCSARCGSLPTS